MNEWEGVDDARADSVEPNQECLRRVARQPVGCRHGGVWSAPTGENGGWRPSPGGLTADPLTVRPFLSMEKGATVGARSAVLDGQDERG